jgi:NAD+ synthase
MTHLDIDPADVARRIETFLCDQVAALRRDGIVLGVSGGIDSATVVTLAARALGPDKVLALLLPERDSSPDSEDHGRLLLERLGVMHKRVDLTPMLSALGIYKKVPLQFLRVRKIQETVIRRQYAEQTRAVNEPPFLAGLLGTRGLDRQRILDAGQAYARAKHRMRLVTLYFYGELENRLVLGTTNKSEAMTGFVVKWGDNVADAEPLLPLYKCQVYQLARYLDVPQRIIDKAPSPDLLPGITDEYALEMSYQLLDQLLYGLEQGQSVQHLASDLGIEAERVEYVRELVWRSAHIRALPPVPDL